jgi:hypothetical protein
MWLLLENIFTIVPSNKGDVRGGKSRHGQLEEVSEFNYQRKSKSENIVPVSLICGF